MKKARILTTVLTVLLIVVMMIHPAFAAYDYGSDNRVYVTGYGHLDTAWQWPYARSIDDLNFNTWRNQLTLMDNNPDYVFTATSPVHYAWAKEYYPSMYEDVKEKFAAGQWDISGGEWTEAETLIASGESTVRQFLVGQKFYEREFGEIAEVGFLPDDPGHSWMLPQIMAKSGIKMFTATRVSALPVDEYYVGQTPHYWATNGTRGWDSFVWQGVDGTKLMSYKPTNWYGSGMSSSDVQTAARYNNIELGMKKSMFYGGSGDMGGGPSQSYIDSIHAINADPEQPNVEFSKLVAFYDSLTDEEKNKIESEHIFNKELYYNHELGLYTSHGEMKKYNNDNEVTAEIAEKLSSISMWLGATEYPVEKINSAWEKMLLAQHHDVLPGCSTADVYPSVWNDEEIALAHFGDSRDYAMEALASRADTTGSDTSLIPVVVFNPLSYERSELVETEVAFDDPVQYARVYDGATEIPCQISGKSADGKTAAVVFVAKNVPSVGYKVFHVTASDEKGTGTDVDITLNGIESALYKVDMDPTNGNINQITDKTRDTNNTVFQDGKSMELHLFQDYNSGTGQESGGGWENWILTWADLTRTPVVLNQNAAVGAQNCQVSTEIVEKGPVRAVYKITKTFRSNTTGSVAPQGNSTIEQYVSVYNGINRVDVTMHVNWRESRRMLKAAFPLAPENELATFDLSYGTVQRGARKESVREVAAQKWADMTSLDGTYGVSILSENKYGWDKYDDKHTLRLSLLRSPKNYDNSTDMGEHDFTFSFYPHGGTWQSANTPRAADSMAKPMVALQTTQHGGALGKDFSFVSTDKDNVSVVAVKKAEDNDDLIVRLYESAGRDNNVTTVTFADTIAEIAETDLIERDCGDVTANDKSFTTTLNHYELKTFRLKLDSDEFEDTKPVVTQIDLSAGYNMDGVTFDHKYTDGAFDANGNTIPAELFPETIVSEDISFNMGPTANGQKNIVMARGQTIDLTPAPEAGTRTVYLLANAEKGPQSGNFRVNYTDGTHTAKTIKVSDWAEYFGGWGKEKNTDRLAHVFTHLHSIKGNSTYKYANLFMYGIAVDSGKTVASIELPANDKIRVFAISTAKGGFLPDEPNTTNGFDNGEDVIFVNDTNTEIVYTGVNWAGYTAAYGGEQTDSFGNKSAGGSRHLTDDKSPLPSIEYSFYGTRIEILAEVGANKYDYDVFIDGEAAGEAVCYREGEDNYKVGQVVYSSQVLDPGTHTIKLQATRNRNSSQYWGVFEGFNIYGGQKVTIIQDTDSAITYSSGWSRYSGTTIGADSSEGGTRTLSLGTPDGSNMYLEFKFIGTRIQFVSELGYNKADFDVYIDDMDTPFSSAICFRGTSNADNNVACNQIVFDSGNLSDSQHKIRLVAKRNANSPNEDIWAVVEAFYVSDYKTVPADPTPPATDNRIINGDSERLTYTGEWRIESEPEAYNGDLHVTNERGAGVSCDFVGNSVRVYGETNSKLAKINIYVDEVKLSTVNITSYSPAHFQTLYSNNMLPMDKHTIRIELVSGELSFDAIMVDSGVEIPADAVWVDNAVRGSALNQILYSGSWSHDTGRAGAYLGTFSYSTSNTATATFRFVGTGFFIIAETHSDHTSNAQVVIDGGSPIRFSQSSQDRTPQTIVYGNIDLEYGEHTVVVKKNSGSYITLDAFVYCAGDSGTIVGNVYDGTSGNRVANAEVSIVDHDEIAPVKTGVNGKFSMIGVPGGEYTLKVSGNAYEDYILNDVAINANRTTVADDIRLVRAGEWVDPDVDTAPVNIEVGEEKTLTVNMGAGGTKALYATVESSDTSVASVSHDRITENTLITITGVDTGSVNVDVKFYFAPEEEKGEEEAVEDEGTPEQKKPENPQEESEDAIDGGEADPDGELLLDVAAAEIKQLDASADDNVLVKSIPVTVSPRSPSAADWERLNKLISDADKLEAKDYTADSWQALESALQAAKDVSGNPSATQDEVLEVISGLENAIDGLYIEVTSVKINGAAIQQVRIRKTQQFTATVGPTNATDKSLTWESSNEKIFTVKDGLVTGLGTGSAKLIVTASNGKTSFIMVQITA